MSQLLEKARGDTGKAKERQKQAMNKRETAEQASYDRRARKLTEQASLFVDATLPSVVDEVTRGIEEVSQEGRAGFTKSWQVDRGKRDPLPVEGLIRYEALRDVAAEHFSQLGFDVQSHDQRNGRQGYEIMGVNPNADRYVPARLTDHVLSLTIAWDSPE